MDSLIEPLSKSAQDYFIEIQRLESNVTSSTPIDSNFDATTHKPSSDNCFTVRAYVYNGDTKCGLVTKPNIWVYMYPYTLMRCRINTPSTTNKELDIKQPVIYNMTFDAMASESVNLTKDFTPCQVQFVSTTNHNSPHLPTIQNRSMKIIDPEVLHSTLKKNYNKSLKTYPNYIVNYGRYEIQPYENDESL